MPIRQLKPYTPPPPAEEPSLLDRIGGIPGVLAGGTRALTGAASAEGGIPGAVISGAGELGAEALEGSLWKQSPLRSLLRVGTAAGIGAVPFGAVLKEGQPLASAARGALYSGGGTAATEMAAGQDVDPTAVATSAAGGGLLTGLMAKLFGKRAPEVPTKKWEVEPTSRAERAPRPIAGDIETKPTPAVQPTSQGAASVSREIPYSYEYAGGPAAKSAAKEAASKTKEELRDQRNLAQVEKWLTRQRAATEKADKQAAAAEEIARIKEEQGLVPRPPRVSESISAPTELGTQRATTTFGKPKAEGEEGVEELAAALEPGPKPKGRPGAVKRPSKIPADWTPPYGPEPVGVPAEPIPQVVAPPTEPPQVVAPTEGVLRAEEPTPLGRLLSGKKGATRVASTLNEDLARIRGQATGKVLTPNQQAQEESYSALLSKLKGETPTSEVPTVTPVAPAIAESPAIQQAKAAFPDEVNTTLDTLGEQYRSLPPGDERRTVGKQMAEIRDFMSGKKMRESWKGASAEPTVSAAIPEDVTPSTPSEPSAFTQKLEQQMGPEPTKAPVTGISQTAKAREAALAARKAKQAEIPPLEPGATPPRQARKFEALFNKLKAERGGSEKGEIDPALLAKLGMTASGAALGAATDPFDNRVESAVAGGAAGFGLASVPQILQSLGAHPETFANLSEKLHIEGVKETSKKIFQTLPQIQRFNYLTSAAGLPANALAGPYGSAVMAALEHGLSDDPRGWAALKLLTPKRFYDEYRPAVAEARRLVAEGEMGRTEGLGVGGGASAAEHALATPGVIMTAGDVAARNILRTAGFTEEEARRITLTGEPELFLPKKIADFGKGRSDATKDLANVLFPFRRTPANIWEQGMERFPGLGFWMQAQRDIPDPMKQQVMQQLISTGVAGVSGLAGANLDPESAKIVKRYMTNFAGQYSMPATMGFTAGQALAGGKPAIPAALKAGIGDLPLPTTQPMSELAKFLTDPSMKNLPSGSYPAVIKEWVQAQQAGSQPIVKPLPRLRRLR